MIQSAPHQQLQVEQIRQNLRHSSARGAALMIGSYAVQLVVGVAGTAVLARLLRPADFGYLAMVATFTNFVGTFRDFGLPMATVHKSDLTHEQVSGLFWINIMASTVVAALVAAMAPALAWFYTEPKLTGITLMMSAGILVHSLSMVHVGVLRRQMKFGAVSALEIGGVIVGVIVGIAAALAGAGYWALVWQQVALYLTQSAGAWMLCRWHPATPAASSSLRDAELRKLIHYGKNESASRVISYIGRNIDAILVGYFVGPRALGLYQRAYQWSVAPFNQMYSPMLPVAVSSFSRLQDDPARYRLYARTAILALFSITLPATGLLFLTAEPVVLLLLGRQWVEAIGIFRILAVGAYFSSAVLVTRWLYLAEGRTREQFRWSLISAACTIAGAAAGLKWGAIGVASGVAAALVLQTLPGLAYYLRGAPLQARDLIGASWRPCVASLVAAALTVAARWLLSPLSSLGGSLGVDLVIYSILYLGFWLLLPGGRVEFSEMLAHLRLLLPARRREP